MENKIRELCAQYGFEEIRTPIFEHTELFVRGVGDTTDVVTKEMYTFEDKGARQITLRPEGTAGVVRAFLENGLFNDVMPSKLFYLYNCFRYEKPQKGRFRQFSQFGIEIFGAAEPLCDAIVISIPYLLMKRLNIKDISLNINSIGCPACRSEYRAALKEYFTTRRQDLCGTCNDRLEKNPMRSFDCKSGECAKVCDGAPSIIDYLCGECNEHFNKVCEYLKQMDIPYIINSRIVRGLDYYNRTVFEFISANIGAQGTVCGGGRYDGLTEQLGGAKIPGIGFAMGLERLMLLADFNEVQARRPDLYIATLGANAEQYAAGLVIRLIKEGAAVCCDVMSRSLKAQMKYADKTGAKYCLVIGDNEISNNRAVLKNMQDGTQNEVSLRNLSANTIR